MEKYFLNLTDSDGTLLNRYEVGVPVWDGELQQLIDDDEVSEIYTLEKLKNIHKNWEPCLEYEIKREIAMNLQKLEIKRLSIKIKGLSPLISHKWRWNNNRVWRG